MKKKTLKAILIGTGVIFFWRGTWGLMDLYVFPNHEPSSYVTSIILGVIILALTHHLIDELM